jgi:oligoribonuclease NrnB/cAMP/cGMP phosphodiesterase (DHH superfamily)
MIYILYHSADLDGHCSGALSRIYFERIHHFKINKDFKMMSINYNQSFNVDISKNDSIYLLDFTLPLERMVELQNIIQDKLIVIDHHISAYKECSDKINNYIYGEESACWLTYKYFFGLPKTHHFLKRLSDYDIWRNEDDEWWNKHVLPFQFGMRMKQTDPIINIELWETLFDEMSFKNLDFVYSIQKNGELLIEYQKQQYKIISKNNAFSILFEGLRAICINNGQYSSLLFESIWDEDKYDIMLAFSYRQEGYWTVGLYTTKNKNIDCSIIAKKYCGGGHKCAAGFKIDDINIILGVK